MDSDRDIASWDQRLKEQVLRRWENYTRLRVHLDTARAAEFTTITGEYLYVEKTSSKSAFAEIRLNRNTNDAISLSAGVVIKTIFETLYLTNTAQPGEWIDLIIGINFEYYKFGDNADIDEVQPCSVVTNALANTNTTGPAQISNRALLKADVNNTQTVWVDFNIAAVQGSCEPLDPGESITVKTSNLNRINANFEVANEKLFITYEV